MADPVTLKSTQKATVTVGRFLSADVPPKEARVEGPPFVVWALDNDGATMVPSADGMSVQVLGAVMAEDAPPRPVRLTGKADANRDPNVQEFIEGFQDFIFTAPVGAVAATMEMTVGAAEDQ